MPSTRLSEIILPQSFIVNRFLNDITASLIGAMGGQTGTGGILGSLGVNNGLQGLIGKVGDLFGNVGGNTGGGTAPYIPGGSGTRNPYIDTGDVDNRDVGGFTNGNIIYDLNDYGYTTSAGNTFNPNDYATDSSGFGIY
jgi:hypothetical protein